MICMLSDGLTVLKNVYVPNWFSKDHFEEILGRTLTQDEFEALAAEINDSLADDVSDLVRQYVNEAASETTPV